MIILLDQCFDNLGVSIDIRDFYIQTYLKVFMICYFVSSLVLDQC